MTGRILQLLLGIVIFFCSTPRAMAQEAIREEVRADFFDGCEVGEEGDRQALYLFDGSALLPEFFGVEQAEDSVENEESKRVQKRQPSPRFFVNKCRFSICLSPEAQAKGVARHLPSQDARQECTAAVRFLQTAALAC